MGRSGTTPVRPTSAYPATAAMVVGDFNGDPHADLAVVVNSSNGGAVLLGKARRELHLCGRFAADLQPNGLVWAT